MGDHRASIKIEFSMYGETKKADMWINWSPYSSDCYGVDQRVMDFFSQSAAEMEANFWASVERDTREKQNQPEKNAHPSAQWVGLTDEELTKLSASGLELWSLWRAIEALLREKNHG